MRSRPAATTEWTLVGDTFVFYGNGGELHMAESDVWLEAVKQSGCTKYVGGVGDEFVTSSESRRVGSAYFVEKKIPFLSITDSTFVRGMVTAGSWLGMNIAAYSWSDLAGGLRWLKVDTALAPEVTRTLWELRERVEQRLALRKSA